MLLTRAEVAATLRVHEATVDRYIKRGLLKAIKTSHAVRISEEALREFLDQNTITPDGEPRRTTEEPAAVDMREVRLDQRMVEAEVPQLRGEPAQKRDAS